MRYRVYSYSYGSLRIFKSGKRFADVKNLYKDRKEAEAAMLRTITHRNGYVNHKPEQLFLINLDTNKVVSVLNDGDILHLCGE